MEGRRQRGNLRSGYGEIYARGVKLQRVFRIGAAMTEAGFEIR